MDWSEHFPILKQMTFMNHAGVAPASGPAAQALRDYADEAATYAYTQSDWYKQAARVKELAAQLINARGRHEIAFIPNTTTGISLVARGLPWQAGDNVIISNVEFPANRYPWEDLKRLGVEVIEVPQQSDGRIDQEDIIEAINDHTRVVALSHVQFASGLRMDLKPVSEALRPLQRHGRGYLCVDGIQSVGVLPVDVQAMRVDFLSADGHKWLLSPEGCGIFYCNEELADVLHPNVVGWLSMVDATNYSNYRFELLPDARRFEPGTYNIPGILALGKSIELLLEVGIDEVWRRVEHLTTRLCDGLASKGYRVFSPRRQDETSGIVIFEPPVDGLDATSVVAKLKEQNVIIVVRDGKLRASPHFYNTEAQIDRLLETLP